MSGGRRSSRLPHPVPSAHRASRIPHPASPMPLPRSEPATSRTARRAWGVATLLLYVLVGAEMLLMSRLVEPRTADTPMYLNLAASIRAGRGMAERNADGLFEPNLLRPPGYPAFLAACQAAFGEGSAEVLVV